MTRTTIDHKKIAETQQKVWSAHIVRVKKGFKKVVKKQAECYEQKLVEQDSKHTEETARIIEQCQQEKARLIEQSKEELANEQRKKPLRWQNVVKVGGAVLFVLFASILLNVRQLNTAKELRQNDLILRYLNSYESMRRHIDTARERLTSDDGQVRKDALLWIKESEKQQQNSTN